jgi:hypothetical protein
MNSGARQADPLRLIGRLGEKARGNGRRKALSELRHRHRRMARFFCGMAQPHLVSAVQVASTIPQDLAIDRGAPRHFDRDRSSCVHLGLVARNELAEADLGHWNDHLMGLRPIGSDLVSAESG